MYESSEHQRIKNGLISVTYSLYLGAIQTGKGGPFSYTSYGSTAILECFIDGKTETFDGWYNDNKQRIISTLRPEKYHVSYDRKRKCYILKIKEMTKEDTGEYTCRTTSGDTITYRQFMDG